MEHKLISKKDFNSVSNYNLKTTLASCFAYKPVVIRKVYNRLIDEAKKTGPFTMEVTASGIYLKTKGIFLIIKPKTKYLLVAFYADREIKEFPVAGSVEVSANRFLHVIHLQQPDNISKQVILLLKKAYLFVEGKSN